MIAKAMQVQRQWFDRHEKAPSDDVVRPMAVRLADNISGCNRRHCHCCHLTKAQPKLPSLRERRFQASAEENG